MASLAEVVPAYNSAQAAAVSTRQRVPGQSGVQDKVVLSQIAPKTEEGGLQAEVDAAYAEMAEERKRLDQEIAGELAELDTEIAATRAKTPSVRELVPQEAGIPVVSAEEPAPSAVASRRNAAEFAPRTPQQEALRGRGGGPGEGGTDTSGMIGFADTAMGQTPFGQAVVAAGEAFGKGMLAATGLPGAVANVALSDADSSSLANLALSVVSAIVPDLGLPATIAKGAVSVFGGGEGDAAPIGPSAGAAHGPSGHGAGAGSGKGGGFSGTIGPSAGAAHGPSGHGAGSSGGSGGVSGKGGGFSGAIGPSAGAAHGPSGHGAGSGPAGAVGSAVGSTGPGAPAGTPGAVGGTMGSSGQGAGTSTGGGGGGGGK